MTSSKDTQLTETSQLARHLILVTLLAVPISSDAALHAPRRPANVDATSTSIEPRPSNRARGHRTYLAMVGPSALSFAEVAPPLPPEPVMPELPKTKVAPAKTGQIDGTSNAARPTESPAENVQATPESIGQPTETGPKPVSILPDDTRREIRAEDVLPYFQFPGSAAGDTVPTVIINPAPATAPPSTATYRQQ